MSWAVTSHFLTPPTNAGTGNATGCAKLKFSHVRDMYDGPTAGITKLSDYVRSSSGLVKINHGASGNTIDNYNPISEYNIVNRHHEIPSTVNGLRLSDFHSVGKEYIDGPTGSRSG